MDPVFLTSLVQTNTQSPDQYLSPNTFSFELPFSRATLRFASSTIQVLRIVLLGLYHSTVRNETAPPAKGKTISVPNHEMKRTLIKSNLSVFHWSYTRQFNKATIVLNHTTVGWYLVTSFTPGSASYGDSLQQIEPIVESLARH